MNLDEESLEDLMRELSPGSQKEVLRIINFLRKLETSNEEESDRADIYEKVTEACELLTMGRRKNRKGTTNKLEQNWAGALSEYGKKYTSLELQKKALEWRAE